MKRFIYFFAILFILPIFIIAQNNQTQYLNRSNLLLSSVNLNQKFELKTNNIFEKQINFQTSQANYFDFKNSSVDTGKLDKSGSVKFLVGNIFTTLGAYAWMIPMTYSPTTQAFIASYTLLGAGGIIIPSLLTRNKDVTMAQANFKNYGQLKGLADGFILDLRLRTNRPLTFAIPSIMSITGATLGYILPDALSMSNDQVLASSTYGLIGYGLGLLSSFSFFPGDSTRLWSPFMVGGSYLGEIGGYFLSKNDDFTAGDSYISMGTSFLGTGLATTILILSENADIVAPTLSLGLAAGIGIGTFLGLKYNINGTHGMLTNAIGLGTGLVAGGITALIISPDKNNLKIFGPVISTASTVGFTLSYIYFIKNFNLQPTNLNKRINFNFDINPAAAYSFYKSDASKMFKYENQYVPVGKFSIQF